MKKQKVSESGQTLVLIALAIFGLLGLVALAIDGGNAFADRRQAQNASDAAALAAAMRFAQDQTLSNNDLASIALARASANGYKGLAPRSTVKLTLLPRADGDCPYNPEGLIFQVDIDSNMPTWFGNIVGISQVHNHVTSKALGCGSIPEPMFGGNTIVVLNKTICRALEFAGSSVTTITSTTNQGVYVNSNCTDPSNGPQSALYGGSGSVSTPSAQVVGGVYGADIFLPTVVQTGAPNLNKKYIWPTVTNAQCGSTSTENPAGTLNPGVYPGTNNSWRHQSFPPAGITNLKPGLYCLDNDFKTTNTNTLNGTDVTIYQRNGIISIQGGSISLSATFANPFPGLLFYVPLSNTGGSITINGGATSSYSGSILAPGAHVTINGGGDTSSPAGPFNTQVVADTISIGGTGTLNLSYDENLQYKPPISAGIQLIK